MSFNSKEVAILAVLVQRPILSYNDRNKLIKELSAPARKIANEFTKKSTKNKLAKAFIDWANSLGD